MVSLKGNAHARQWVVWSLAVLVLAAGQGLSRAQVSLATVVDLAQRNSSAVLLADADVKRAQAALAQTKDVFFPSVSFGSGLPALPAVGFTGNPPSIFNASMQAMVLSFPQRNYIKSASEGTRAALLALKDAREQAALDAATAYIELDTVHLELGATRQQQAGAQRLVEIEKQRAEAGVDPLSELLQAQLNAAQIKLKLLHLETRAATLAQQLATLTGLPVGTITTDKASIPEIPAIRADQRPQATAGVEAARLSARSRQFTATGDSILSVSPQISLNAQYNRDTTLLNNANSYYARPLKSDNFGSGFAIQIPLFDLGLHSKARQSAAEALRAKIEAEQAQRQNDAQIAQLTGSLRELDALAEIASLKQQIADEQLHAVMTQLEFGNGSGAGANAQPQLSPKAEQLARIDERQKYEDSLDAGLDLARTRLSLLRALGHMEDWLRTVEKK